MDLKPGSEGVDIDQKSDYFSVVSTSGTVESKYVVNDAGTCSYLREEFEYIVDSARRPPEDAVILNQI